MSFVSDQLFNDQPFQSLVILDCHTRKPFATCARANFRTYRVAKDLSRLVALCGTPASIRLDNGLEFAGRMLDQWTYLNKDFSRPGKPTDNSWLSSRRSTPACAANT